MNKYTEKYRKIVDEFVKNYYPNLSGRTRIILEDRFVKGSAFVLPALFFSIIGVSTKVRDYSEDSVKGLFAHELAHLDKNRDKNIFYFIRWVFDKKVRADYERDADEHAIEVGLGEFLLASAETDVEIYSPEEMIKRHTIDGYMSPDEIRKEIGNRYSF
ncbi:MAG: hypothetical protein ISS82_06115 [Nanoarchaeota archaeon]|nr:hypothetical protein [Nanoarchaeota archaeon]